jgi:hypothetical protein
VTPTQVELREFADHGNPRWKPREYEGDALPTHTEEPSPARSYNTRVPRYRCRFSFAAVGNDAHQTSTF